MLPQAERLRKSGLFQRVYSEKKSVSGTLVTLYVIERQPRSAPKLPLVGFVVSKKTHAGAAQRNRAKRRVREAYRQARQQIMAEGGEAAKDLRRWYSLVFNIKAEVLEAPFADICQCVGECLTKASEKWRRRAGRC
jgi:ribonuclease P protein component